MEALQVTAEEGEAGKVQGDRAGFAEADADGRHPDPHVGRAGQEASR